MGCFRLAGANEGRGGVEPLDWNVASSEMPPWVIDLQQ